MPHTPDSGITRFAIVLRYPTLEQIERTFGMEGFSNAKFGTMESTESMFRNTPKTNARIAILPLTRSANLSLIIVYRLIQYYVIYATSL